MYAKLISDDELKYAPYYLVVDNKIILNPQQQDYLNAGYKPVVYMPMPLSETDQDYVRTITEEENQITITYALVENETDTVETSNDTTTS